MNKKYRFKHIMPEITTNENNPPNLSKLKNYFITLITLIAFICGIVAVYEYFPGTINSNTSRNTLFWGNVDQELKRPSFSELNEFEVAKKGYSIKLSQRRRDKKYVITIIDPTKKPDETIVLEESEEIPQGKYSIVVSYPAFKLHENFEGIKLGFFSQKNSNTVFNMIKCKRLFTPDTTQLQIKESFTWTGDYQTGRDHNILKRYEDLERYGDFHVVNKIDITVNSRGDLFLGIKLNYRSPYQWFMPLEVNIKTILNLDEKYEVFSHQIGPTVLRNDYLTTNKNQLILHQISPSASETYKVPWTSGKKSKVLVSFTLKDFIERHELATWNNDNHGVSFGIIDYQIRFGQLLVSRHNESYETPDIDSESRGEILVPKMWYLETKSANNTNNILPLIHAPKNIQGDFRPTINTVIRLTIHPDGRLSYEVDLDGKGYGIVEGRYFNVPVTHDGANSLTPERMTQLRNPPNYYLAYGFPFIVTTWDVQKMKKVTVDSKEYQYISKKLHEGQSSWAIASARGDLQAAAAVHSISDQIG